MGKYRVVYVNRNKTEKNGKTEKQRDKKHSKTSHLQKPPTSKTQFEGKKEEAGKKA